MRRLQATRIAPAPLSECGDFHENTLPARGMEGISCVRRRPDQGAKPLFVDTVTLGLPRAKVQG
jgi:hypothetical protein